MADHQQDMRFGPGGQADAQPAATQRRIDVARTLRGDRGFGPVWQGDGVVFRLWAPGQAAVTLLLPERKVGERALDMEGDGEGWFSLFVSDVPAGMLYGFRLEDGTTVPDPASRYQPRDVHGFSALVNPHAYRWTHTGWTGRAWHEAVLSEIHVGAFSPEGSFEGVRRRLGRLAETGVTGIVLLPVGACPGERNWGYDSVLPYATSANYGLPDDLKRLVDSAHGHGLMVLLDVTFDRLGPDGNYLSRYAPSFFLPADDENAQPAIDFGQRPVREFFLRNALTWIEEFRMDGLRVHGAHAIDDPSLEHILYELRRRVDERVGGSRMTHLILENAENEARYLERGSGGRVDVFTGQRNDDFHHAMHAVLANGPDHPSPDFLERPVAMLGRCLAQGFAFQGEISPSTGRARGEPSGGLPPAAFINHLDCADWLGARPGGERLTARTEPLTMQAALGLLLLAPMPPQLFMGEEWGAEEPFPLFFDFPGLVLDASMRLGRPDPCAVETFDSATLDWCKRTDPGYADRLAYVSGLLALRHRLLMPRLEGMVNPAVEARILGAQGEQETGLMLRWILGDNASYTLVANLGPAPLDFGVETNLGRCIFSTHPGAEDSRELPGWYVSWFLGGTTPG